ncbi:protein-disulfide isomerase [Dechloromonas denitrificans]|uniref:Protein-disulfide isomerase n=1 Tax=Dechloromonas denitrificans TaxID=281362 RepID=A0A133XK27_9RHOO|nr:DsbA family protein [Dechloromonas denitrificans]KXB31291.1 protein-disulfide isomerase [Dechloromonas denitrificans]
MTTTLHYIYDPLCGWCYGAAPLVKAARAILDVLPHSGGMMAGAQRQAVTPQLRAYVKQHDERIAQLTGQPFGLGYSDGLLCDTGAVFDSEPPTAAILAAEQMAGRGLDMLTQLQIAHYVEGRHIAERATLIAVAATLDLDPAAFAAALDRQFGEAVQTHIRATRELMAEVGAQGFPSFVLEAEGVMQSVDIAGYLGRPQEFQDWLRGQTNLAATTTDAGTFACDINRCAI